MKSRVFRRARREKERRSLTVYRVDREPKKMNPRHRGWAVRAGSCGVRRNIGRREATPVKLEVAREIAAVGSLVDSSQSAGWGARRGCFLRLPCFSSRGPTLVALRELMRDRVSTARVWPLRYRIKEASSAERCDTVAFLLALSFYINFFRPVIPRYLKSSDKGYK